MSAPRHSRLLGRYLLAAVALVVLSGGVPGCVRSPARAPASAASIEGVVREYDRLLSEGFARQDMNLLSPAATKRQAQEEYYQMAALGEGKLRLVATLRSLSFGAVSFPSEASATVETREIWDYEQVSTETSRVVRTERGVVYNLRYDLVLDGGRWFVDRVVSTEATQTK